MDAEGSSPTPYIVHWRLETRYFRHVRNHVSSLLQLDKFKFGACMSSRILGTGSTSELVLELRCE